MHYRSIDQLNRERKLQQSAAGSELRVLEDQYYSALRKNLEISAACQGVEDDLSLLQARMDRLTKQQQQQEQGQPQGGGQDGQQQQGQSGEEEQQQQQEQPAQEQQQPMQNGVETEAPDAAGVAEPMEQ